MEKLLRQKQGRDAHTERRRVGNRPREEECSLQADTSFILGNSSGTLSSFRPIIWFLFLHLTCPGSLPWGMHEPLSQDGSSSEGFWEEEDALWPGITPDLWPTRSPSALVSCLPWSQKTGKWRSLSSLLKREFAFLCPCHDYYFKVFTEDKHWLFTLFPFQRANRKLTVNASTGTHPSLVSGNANRRLAVNI